MAIEHPLHMVFEREDTLYVVDFPLTTSIAGGDVFIFTANGPSADDSPC